MRKQTNRGIVLVPLLIKIIGIHILTAVAITVTLGFNNNDLIGHAEKAPEPYEAESLSPIGESIEREDKAYNSASEYLEAAEAYEEENRSIDFKREIDPDPVY